MNTDNIKYFFPKVRNRFRARRNQFWKHANMGRVSMRGYVPFADAISFKKHLQAMVGSYNADVLSGISVEDKSVILNTAEQALHHEFDLLGSGPVTLNPIDWHVDFKCGERWEKRFYMELRYIKGADIKVPWELSRCQHLLWLGEAYLLTGEEKFAKEIVDEIEWWIDDNPLMFSVNWKCAMDVAFRAVNWMYALNMISNYEGFDARFSEKVTKSLWQHAFFIRNNLEKQIPYSNNHYFSDVVGLLYLGLLFDDTRRGRQWKHFAKREFIKETRKQVLPSGFHYERSVSYHRLMTEMTSYPVYILKRKGEELPKDIVERIGKMYKYTATYTKPNGLAPLIADNDDGRFVPFLRRDFCKHNYLNDKDSVENRFVAVGMQPLFCAKTENEVLYGDAGVAVAKLNNNYLFVNNGGYSKHPKESDVKIGTHTHNDLLSFELVLNGEDVLVDSGTFLYTSSISDRNEFRSTKKHNTIMVDGEEQNDFSDAFTLRRNVYVGDLRRLDNNAFEGEYNTIKGGMTHKRSFQLTDKGLNLIDVVSKNGLNHELKLFFHCGIGCAPKLSKDAVLINKNQKNISLGFSIQPKGIEIEEDTISPSFGVKKESKTVIITYKFDESIIVETVIKEIK